MWVYQIAPCTVTMNGQVDINTTQVAAMILVQFNESAQLSAAQLTQILGVSDESYLHQSLLALTHKSHPLLTKTGEQFSVNLAYQPDQNIDCFFRPEDQSEEDAKGSQEELDQYHRDKMKFVHRA